MIEDLQDYFAGRVGRVRDMAERAAAGPLMIRAAIAVFAALSLVLAFPPEVMRNFAGIVLAGIVALLPAVFTRTRLVGLAIFSCAFGFLIGKFVYGYIPSIPHLVGLSTTLYLMHSLAALAAVLPYDAIVSPGVLSGWLLRALGVVAVSALVSVVMLLVVKVTLGPVFLAASLVGVLAAGALAYLVARRASQ
ncbi:hypothetical protein Dvina_49115 [Dactylosporangium vinaceum]|uniref:Uncharacterized protein n=1 Tax=Dactylosporangium vinaceum TaxID=53362 RepID=A0ABV5LYF7_9ACTN|nr:hypothetical protein [Dactylosporangium vinaceum]UAB95853.1 hypothetical protein Dvina_49115 [Dactylosporangium vinaceum]